MDFINYKSQKIKISLEPQTGVLGRPFRLSGISKNTLVPQKFTNGIYYIPISEIPVYISNYRLRLESTR